ncbi:MAG: tetratricopeptide repeat protein [Planctomycetota bacterium]|jgi:tetratricopeptide (TPR) repeat protein
MLRGPTLFLCGAVLVAGCMSWKTAYPTVEEPDPGAAADLPARLAEAARLAGAAGDRKSLQSALAAYEKILEVDGANFKALCELGHLYVLLGAAYGAGSGEKGRSYKQAADYNARAMYTNAEFKKLVDEGATLAEASRVLGRREMDAMGFWCQALFYYYKERLGALGRILNFKWILAAQTVLARMEEVDPDWQRGGLTFSNGIIYIALPKVAGGDKVKAKECVDGAVAKHPDVIRNRWGRAKYYYTVMGEKEAFRKDLEWVLKQDPRGWGPYAWNVYFKDDAKRMLEGIDRSFR